MLLLQTQCISAAYEAASNLDPKNRALVEQMFGGFVREGNLVKQQQVRIACGEISSNALRDGRSVSEIPAFA